jgi:hypothetical protein
VSISVHDSGQTISWFKDRLLEEKLIFKPPFQRNPVWLQKHKAYLVDTVLHNLPVPEVYIQKDTDERGDTLYSIIDGQQRVRALLEFARGEVELMEKYTPGKGGYSWDDLTSAEKTGYWNYRLIVREVTGATDPELRDMFIRLNQHSITLNAQELRNARYAGDFITTMTELADQEFWAENRIVSASEIRRMLDIEYISELTVAMMHGPQNKKYGLEQAFQTYDDRIPDKHKWLRRFESARAMTIRLVPDLPSRRWCGKSDYYSLFLTLDTLGEQGYLPVTKESTVIRKLREFGDAVTKELAAGTSGTARSRAVREYAKAVEKAASDKGRREIRHRILIELLEPHFVANTTVSNPR